MWNSITQSDKGPTVSQRTSNGSISLYIPTGEHIFCLDSIHSLRVDRTFLIVIHYIRKPWKMCSLIIQWLLMTWFQCAPRVYNERAARFHCVSPVYLMDDMGWTLLSSVNTQICRFWFGASKALLWVCCSLNQNNWLFAVNSEKHCQIWAIEQRIAMNIDFLSVFFMIKEYLKSGKNHFLLTNPL